MAMMIVLDDGRFPSYNKGRMQCFVCVGHDALLGFASSAETRLVRRSDGGVISARLPTQWMTRRPRITIISNEDDSCI